MSAPIKTKEELTRLAWITELRRRGHRQCHGAQTGAMMGQDNDTSCALRLLADITGGFTESLTRSVAHRAGLSERQGSIIIMLNDGEVEFGDHHLPPEFAIRQHTFAEIADIVDGWFKP